MKIIRLFLIGYIGLTSCFTYADDKLTSSIDVYASRTGEVPCERFKGVVRDNCELTTKILLTSYLEYCSTRDCTVLKKEDMIAWLEKKEAVIAKSTKTAEFKTQ